ncbi:hypothetical protein ERO13_A11G278400v2 [Gossypium hirsutum]|uniref:Transcription factor MYB97 n=3 Tax=Gossypium TaxID=3633 RepID=A0A1U8MPL4_GOSHI|nr:transcription factor MYB97-like [Gossypium hirsutum]KAG4176979.1 hypothetical protein ERO13_A11G278400v2 [Gossypium hirsutum]TYJ11848.1 hypothetical protein E1A91_A11G305400v1 [Gossypium mustelinum]
MMMMMMGGGNNQFTAQNESGGSLGNNGMNNGGVGVGREGEIVLKKGPWTAAEDAVLAGYVRRHGEGNWNAVRKNTGLARCGKSCRLRWANHLRPNLKKGSFSPEEERIIIELHAKMGNRWARMATQLPGRTDNEIKNYWNTRVKRRQRQGLPLYPPDVQPHYSQHRQRHSHPPSPIPSPPPTTEPNSCFSFQTPVVSPHTSNPMPLHPLHIPHRPPPQNFLYNPHSALTTPPPPLQSPNSASAPPPLPSPNALTPPHTSPLYSPHNPSPFPTLPLFDYPNITTDDDFFHSNKRFKHDGLQSNNYNNIHLDATSSSFTLPFSPMQHYSNGMTLDLPSSSRTAFNHHPHQDSGCFYPLKTDLRSNQINDDGLLENILQEARALAANGRGGNKEMPKEMMNSAQNEEEDYSRLINIDGLSSLGMAIPEWCNDSGESSERQPSVITDNENHLALDMHQIASLYPADISPNHAARSSSVRSWDKFPGLC